MSLSGYAQTATIPDPIFLNYLKTTFPQTINSLNQLIIANAAQVTSNISCGGLGITNLEGIQFFSKVTKISAINNAIVSIPLLLPMTKLETVHLYGNKLTSVPSFVGIQNLKTVLLYENKLTQMPLFGNNPIIEEIIISKNNISTISSLTGVPSLLKLDVGENQLTQLPDLSLNVNLKELICWSNQLIMLPSLKNLVSLTRLNAGKNKLTQSPDLSANTQLSILAFDNNLLTAIPDITGFSNLTNVKLHKNYLTFEDLLPYASVSNFSSIYIYSPMLPLPGDTIDAYYNEPVVVHSNIDVTTANVTYKWYEGATVISSGAADEVTISQPSGAGITKRYLYVELTHPSLPSLTLVTDTILVRFNPCPTATDISYIATKIDCGNSGTVQVEVGGYASPLTTYILTSASLGTSTYYNSNKINGLSDTAYSLQVNFTSSCIVTYVTPIKMPAVDCNEAFMTPNNDGDMDTYLFTGKGSLAIYDKYGKEVKRANLPFLWDGSGNYGLVQPGYYIVVINGGKERIYISVLY